MGFRLGLTSESPLLFLVEGAEVAVSLPRPTDFPLAGVFVGGASPLLMPSPPRFMMLAGVTGVML